MTLDEKLKLDLLKNYQELGSIEELALYKHEYLKKEKQPKILFVLFCPHCHTPIQVMDNEENVLNTLLIPGQEKPRIHCNGCQESFHYDDIRHIIFGNGRQWISEFATMGEISEDNKKKEEYDKKFNDLKEKISDWK